MKFILFTFIFLFSSLGASAGIELLVGAGIGKVEFKSETPRVDKYTGNSFQMQGTARGTWTTGRLQIGAGVTRASGKASLEADTGDDSDIEFKHLYYGPVFGYIIHKGLRIDLEYYTDSTIEVTKTDDNTSDVLRADDKIFGKGFGVGVSLLRGYFITQLLYQSFSPDRVELDGIEFDAGSDEVSQFNIQNLSLQFGLLF